MDQIKFVSPDDIERLFKKIHSLRDSAMFTLAYYYGMRCGELRLLQITDIDLANDRIYIRALKNGLSGQHYLNPVAKKRVKIYLERERLRKRTVEGSLFLSQKGTVITTTQIYRLFREYARKARFPENLRHPHILRHSVACHLAESGADLYQVREHLRHRKIENTAIYFALTNKTRLEKQREAFNSPMLAKI